jgi:two-component system sensor histidine kinase AgrC
MLKHRRLKREHSHLLQKSSQNINTCYQKKSSQELFIKDEAENIYDIIRFQQNEEAQELLVDRPNYKII